MPAAGRGKRLGADIPKQYLTLAGRSMLEWSVQPFLADSRCQGLVVALAAGDAHWPAVRARLARVPIEAVGGEERADSVRAALQLSLNVPAVAVLDRLGTARFMQALAGAGAVAEFDRRASEAPGLPVILGGVGISLADMAMLYAALADDGRARPLVLRHGAAREAGEGRPFVDPRAAQWTREILRGVPPPEPWSQRGGARPIAWKTGTSYGFRDALAFGSTRRFTVGVWVGRADGTLRPGQYGRTAAAPILFKAFDLLPQEAWPDAPQRLGPPPRCQHRWCGDHRGTRCDALDEGPTVDGCVLDHDALLLVPILRRRPPHRSWRTHHSARRVLTPHRRCGSLPTVRRQATRCSWGTAGHSRSNPRCRAARCRRRARQPCPRSRRPSARRCRRARRTTRGRSRTGHAGRSRRP